MLNKYDIAQRYCRLFIYRKWPAMSERQKEIALRATLLLINEGKAITPEEVLQKLEANGVKLVRERTRKDKVVVDRFIVYYFLSKKCKMSSIAIGHYCGYDHATVLHGIKVINTIISYDKVFKEKIKFLNKII